MTHCPACMRALDPIQDVADRVGFRPNHKRARLLIDLALHGSDIEPRHVADGKDRRPGVVAIRQALMWIMHKEMGLTLSETASAIGVKRTSVHKCVMRMDGHPTRRDMADRLWRLMQAREAA